MLPDKLPACQVILYSYQTPLKYPQKLAKYKTVSTLPNQFRKAHMQNQTPIKPSDILEAALEIIRTQGHHKGDLEDPETGAVCALGAINQAVCGNSKGAASGILTYPATKYLRRYIPESHESIPSYNDDPSTTEEDIYLLFKNAISDAETDECRHDTNS